MEERVPARERTARALTVLSPGWKQWWFTHPLGGAILSFLWPLLYYYRFLIPDYSFSLVLENDFIPLYAVYKAYLLDLLAAGHFPLWSPSEAAGYPFYASPFTQAFYPLNYPLVLFYKIAGGYSVFDHQRFTVLAVSILCLGLFLWLRHLVTNPRAILFAVFLGAMNFRIGEILRLPNAAHAAAWIPWILYGVTLLLKGEHVARGSLILFGASALMLSAGYPYYPYYCLFLVPPFILALMLPWTRAALMQNGAGFPLKGNALLALGTSILCAGLLCCPYMYKMKLLMGQTLDRGGRSYEYATAHEFDPVDTVGSLLFPPVSHPEGWYYFGTAGLFLLILYAVHACLNKKEKTARILLLSAGAWMAVISWITYGKVSSLHWLLWTYLPGFSQLRTPARMNILLIPALCLVLARAYEFFERELFAMHADGKGPWSPLFRQFITLALSSLAVLLIQASFWKQRAFEEYWETYFPQNHGHEHLFLFATIGSTLLLAGMLCLFRFTGPRARVAPLLVFGTLVTASVLDLRPAGSTQWSLPQQNESQAERAQPNITQTLKQSLLTPRRWSLWTISLDPSFNLALIPNWYFERYARFLGGVPDKGSPPEWTNQEEQRAFEIVMGMVNGRRLFYSREIDHSSVREFLRDCIAVETEISPRVQVLGYDGDSLNLRVRTPREIYVNFIDNWDPDWKAFLDRVPAPIARLFGTFKAVKVPAGEHTLLFSYQPFS
jgi:hypothetical protein